MINVLTQVAVTLVAWFILRLVCTNLVGFLVRGFFTNPEMDRLAVEADDFIKDEVQSYYATQRKTNIVALVLIIVFLAALYYFWNIGLVIAAMTLMATRIPDLIWEIKHGRKLDRLQRKLQPRAYMLTSVISWASVPVVWYALYRM